MPFLCREREDRKAACPVGTGASLLGVVKKKVGPSVTSRTYSGLKKKKTYYVKVRAYKNVNGAKKYGKWSSRKSVVIRR